MKVEILAVQREDGVYVTLRVDGEKLPGEHLLREGEVTLVETPEDRLDRMGRRLKHSRIREHSKRQEADIAKEAGGYTQRASGATKWHKGDVRVEGRARIEAKFTYANSYSLELSTMHKIASEASAGEIPLVAVDFKSRNTGKSHEELVVGYRQDILRLINAHSDNSRVPKRRGK